MATLLLVLLGFVAGVIGPILGLGGGIILVPALTLIAGMPAVEAAGTSLTGVVAVSTASAIEFLDSGRADLELGIILETATALGAFIGATLSQLVPERLFYLLFAVVLVYAAINMARPSAGVESEKADSRARNKGLGLGLSFLAGNISALLGIGGGILKVPVLNLVMRVPLKIATATSSYMIGITAATASAVYILKGHVDLHAAAAIIVGISIGGRLGTTLSYRIRVWFLRWLFVAVLFYTAARMLLRGA